MPSIIISMEGVNTYTLGYVVRELTVHFPGFGRRTYNFAAPPTSNDLDIKSMLHYRDILNGADPFNPTPGELPHQLLKPILESFGSHKLYTAGSLAAGLLRHVLPYTWVVDLYEEYGFRYPKILHHSPRCCMTHNPRYCSDSKALQMLKFMN